MIICVSIDFIFLFFFCYNSEILGWCKTQKSVCFGVCCSASNVSSHSLWGSTPTMHCMDHHVSYSLWADGGRKSAYKFWFWFILNFLLLPYVRLVIEVRHAFHQQNHCVNYKYKERCTSVAEGFHHVNTGCLVCKQMNCLEGGFIFTKPKRDQEREPNGLKQLYILCIWSVLYSDVCS